MCYHSFSVFGQEACGILVPPLGIERTHILCIGRPSLNHQVLINQFYTQERRDRNSSILCEICRNHSAFRSQLAVEDQIELTPETRKDTADTRPRKRRSASQACSRCGCTSNWHTCRGPCWSPTRWPGWRWSPSPGSDELWEQRGNTTWAIQSQWVGTGAPLLHPVSCRLTGWTGPPWKACTLNRRQRICPTPNPWSNGQAFRGPALCLPARKETIRSYRSLKE